jgi:rSAM/selenodomain-associated transferase 2
MNRLSVIIPTHNEEHTLEATLESARRGNPWEILVIDGGSTDRTPEIAQGHGAVVLSAPLGRAQQMNVGAAAAAGDLLLFLHADTRLPWGYEEQIVNALARPGVVAGAFTLRIDAPRWSLRLIEKFVILRSRWLQFPYGDQTLFLRREVFQHVGGFPEIAAMEDFEMVRRLRRLGHIEIVPTPVLTSPRRWLGRGVVRTTLLNQACVAAHLLGVSPHRIAAWRRGRIPPVVPREIRSTVGSPER